MHQLPDKGSSSEEITLQVDQLLAEMTPESAGKVSSTAFWGTSETNALVKETFLKFFSWNALFSFQESVAARIENEVLDICVSLVGGDDIARGNLTSGGTESNYCAFHAMRNWARENHPEITHPEIVAPYSIHSTVHKMCRVLDIKVVTVPQKLDLSADIEGMRSAIGPNTIGIAASAPNWPYACVDPIEALGEIAIQNDLWLHVDACVGAYILPYCHSSGNSAKKSRIMI